MSKKQKILLLIGGLVILQVIGLVMLLTEEQSPATAVKPTTMAQASTPTAIAFNPTAMPTATTTAKRTPTPSSAIAGNQWTNPNSQFGAAMAIMGAAGVHTPTPTPVVSSAHIDAIFGDGDGQVDEYEIIGAVTTCVQWESDGYFLQTFKYNANLGEHGLLGNLAVADIEHGVNMFGENFTEAVCRKVLAVYRDVAGLP